MSENPDGKPISRTISQIALFFIAVLIGVVGSIAYLYSDNRIGPRSVHVSFELTADDLSELVGDQPPEIQSNIDERSWYFLELIARVLDEPRELLVLVDKQHALRSEYVPRDLISLEEYGVSISRPDLRVRLAIIPDLVAMTEAARIDGVELVFSSAYRSYEYQDQVYRRNVESLGQARADRESAEPGKSEHQLGTTIDFGSITDAFAETDAGRWLFANAWRFGFSLSYPEGYEEMTGYRHEIWHYRYLSRPAALLSREFFDSVHQFLLEFLDNHSDRLRSARSVENS